MHCLFCLTGVQVCFNSVANAYCSVEAWKKNVLGGLFAVFLNIASRGNNHYDLNLYFPHKHYIRMCWYHLKKKKKDIILIPKLLNIDQSRSNTSAVFSWSLYNIYTCVCGADDQSFMCYTQSTKNTTDIARPIVQRLYPT